MRIKRRNFLERIGLGLLGLGIVDNLAMNEPKIKRYYETLAETTKRKLALLIGINNYGEFPSLKGCLTDVELQKELLINRFGFQPQDIVILTDQNATRENIETTFNEHLIKQAKSGDIVVFHYSGYGSQVNLSNNTLFKNNNPNEALLINSLVPFNSKNRILANDILLQTLLGLNKLLLTNKITMVLDTSFLSNNELDTGIFPQRSLPNKPAENLNPEEIRFLENVINNNLLAQNLLNQKNNTKKNQLNSILANNFIDSSLFQGSILTGIKEKEIAKEIEIKGVYTGLFTYLLTQYLWEMSAATNIQTTAKIINLNLNKITNNTQNLNLFTPQQNSTFTYYTLPEQNQGAEGIITQVDDNNRAKCKLLGLPPDLMQNYGINSYFTVINAPVKLQITSQTGLKCQGKIQGETSNLQGKFIQEYIRMLPKEINLTVALDNTLTRIERVDATSAFSLIESVSSVITKGEQWADCILSKTKDEKYQLLDINGKYLSNTKGIANEAVKLAVKRLETTLNNLLAAKIWNLTINNYSSRLGAKITLETSSPSQQTVFQQQTLRYAEDVINPPAANTSLTPTLNNLNLKIGTKIQFRIENYSPDRLYYFLIGINAHGNPFTIYTPDSTTESIGIIPPQQSLNFPDPTQGFDWNIYGDLGLSKVIIFLSKTPFIETFSVLKENKQFQGGVEKLINISQPLKIAQSILKDLDHSSQVSSELGGENSDFYALDVNKWASFNFSYNVINS